MQVRTVTCFTDPGFPLGADVMREAARVASRVKHALEDAGYEVQSLRLALPAFAPFVQGNEKLVVALALELEKACEELGIDYATMGVSLPGDPAAVVHAIPAAIAVTSRIFASSLVASSGSGVDMPALLAAASAVSALSKTRPDGFDNLRFAALFNVPPGVPFLPAAYHDGGAPFVAIGVEAASVAVDALAEAASWPEAQKALVARVEAHAARVLQVARAGAGATRVAGIDFSLAPFPDAARSIGTAIERLSGGCIGQVSTLAAVACLAETLDRARIDRTGYSGVFLPVFEDAVLAARTVEGRVGLNELLLYSSVCGTGLDTVPLPGDTDRKTLSAILLDVAALALRLDKPLSARLMPIPGKRAGDAVRFDFPYFAPSRVIAIDSPAAAGLLLSAVTLAIGPRVRLGTGLSGEP
ncbi:MAG: DUF711 family protein [Vicinamibacterales bacterium]